MFIIVEQANTSACSCVDCEQSCPAPPKPMPPSKPFLIFNMDGYAVVMFFVFLIFSVLFVIGAYLCAPETSVGKFSK